MLERGIRWGLRLAVLLFLGGGGQARSLAFSLYYVENATYTSAVMNGGGQTYLDPAYATRIGPSSSQAVDAENLLEVGWPSWSISRSSSDPPGDVAVSEHAAWQEYQNGHVVTAGGHLKFDYISSDSLFPYYRFVQVIYTNAPTGGATSPYIDPGITVDYYPFYYDEDYNSSMRSGTHYTFWDHPSRTYDGSQAIGWAGALFLVEWYSAYGANAVIIHDGVYWGWRTEGTGGNDMWSGGGGDLVPEPPSLIAFSTMVSVALLRRWRRR